MDVGKDYQLLAYCKLMGNGQNPKDLPMLPKSCNFEGIHSGVGEV